MRYRESRAVHVHAHTHSRERERAPRAFAPLSRSRSGTSRVTNFPIAPHRPPYPLASSFLIDQPLRDYPGRISDTRGKAAGKEEEWAGDPFGD